MIPKPISAILIAAFALSLAPARADQAAFEYRAFELETAGGVKALYARLAREAKYACRNASVRSIAQMKADHACALRLTDEWVAKIDSPRLQRLHANARGSYEIAVSR